MEELRLAGRQKLHVQLTGPMMTLRIGTAGKDPESTAALLAAVDPGRSGQVLVGRNAQSGNPWQMVRVNIGEFFALTAEIVEDFHTGWTYCDTWRIVERTLPPSTWPAPRLLDERDPSLTRRDIK